MKPQDVAVQVAAEAVRSGDAESIADAKVGLAALGVTDHSIQKQLALAAALLDPKAALVSNGEAGFVELVIEAWKRKQLSTVTFGFSQLALGLSESDLEAISTALAKANGKRRTELIDLADVLSIALELRNGAASARRPPDDRRWRKRDTLRSFCALTRQEDGSAVLELGSWGPSASSRTRRPGASRPTSASR